MMPPARAATVGAGAVVLCVAALAIWWPGVAAYDSVEQYRQALAGEYADWHPPAMARLWAVLHPLADGAAPMFVLQVVLGWLGLGLIAAALARGGHARAGLAVLALGASPIVAGWQGVVLKDAQLLGALLAAVGLAGWWRLASRRLPAATVGAVVVLIGYATLVRANAPFATVPLAVALVPWPVRPARRVVAAVLGVLAVVALAPPINHRLLGAEAGPVARTLPIYDLAGIDQYGGGAGGMLLPAERREIAARHCYTPFFWDPLGEDAHCGDITTRLDEVPMHDLQAAWIGAILRHPLAYAEHRLGHLNSTDRLIVAAGWESAAPIAESEANDLGLGSPGGAAAAVARAGGWMADTPLGWPAAWIVVAATALWIALLRPAGPARDLALALAWSSLMLEASFAVVSIASDLRYHLWSMTAAALAAILVATGRPWPRAPLLAGGALLALVAIAGAAARLTLPHAPVGYAAMLG